MLRHCFPAAKVRQRTCSPNCTLLHKALAKHSDIAAFYALTCGASGSIGFTQIQNHTNRPKLHRVGRIRANLGRNRARTSRNNLSLAEFALAKNEAQVGPSPHRPNFVGPDPSRRSVANAHRWSAKAWPKSGTKSAETAEMCSTSSHCLPTLGKIRSIRQSSRRLRPRSGHQTEHDFKCQRNFTPEQIRPICWGTMASPALDQECMGTRFHGNSPRPAHNGHTPTIKIWKAMCGLRRATG